MESHLPSLQSSAQNRTARSPNLRTLSQKMILSFTDKVMGASKRVMITKIMT